MILRPPRSTRTGPLCPYRTLVRSDAGQALVQDVRAQMLQVKVDVVLGRADAAALADLHRHRARDDDGRSEEHTSELQSLMRTSYVVFCLIKQSSNCNPIHMRYRHITRHNNT